MDAVRKMDSNSVGVKFLGTKVTMSMRVSSDVASGKSLFDAVLFEIAKLYANIGRREACQVWKGERQGEAPWRIDSTHGSAWMDE